MLIADFPSHEMLKNLNNLKNIGGQKFSKDLINTDETFYHGKTKGSWETHDGKWKYLPVDGAQGNWDDDEMHGIVIK